MSNYRIHSTQTASDNVQLKSQTLAPQKLFPPSPIATVDGFADIAVDLDGSDFYELWVNGVKEQENIPVIGLNPRAIELAVQPDDDATLGNVTLNELTVLGDAIIQGSSILIDSEIKTADAVIDMNYGELGTGVTLGFSGQRIDRGTLTDFWTGFDEVRDGFSIGEITDLTPAQIATTQLLVTRADTLTDSNLMMWDDTAKQLVDSGLDFSSGGLALNGLTLSPVTPPIYAEGLLFYDTDNKSLSFYNDESDITLQIGQENWFRAKNSSGGLISNGEIVYISGEDGGLSTVGLANATTISTALPTIGVATHDVEDGTTGHYTRLGSVRGLNTSAYTAGDILYLSTTGGGMTNVPPDSPNFQVIIGTVGVSHATEGVLEVHIGIGGNTAGVIKVFNGSVYENTSVVVSSDGATVTLSVEKVGGGDMSLFFDGMFTVFDSTPAATVVLTAGSDTAPTDNYVYIPKSTGVLTVSTSGFTTTEQFVPLATLVIPSATKVQAEGCYKCHKWSDNLSDTKAEGHITHVNSWIRQQNATWKNGVMPTTTFAAVDTEVYFQTTSGSVLQLHEHSFPARNTQTGDPAFIINDPTTNYLQVTNLADADQDSLGGSLRSNNSYYSLVVWGVVSEDDSDCKIFINLPSGKYGNETDAQSDPLSYTDTTIPSSYTGAGFLIARIVLKYQTSGGGTFTELDTHDLTGEPPGVSGGGGSGTGTTEFSDNLFKLLNVSDVSKKVAFDLSGLTTATERTLTVPDVSGVLAVQNDNVIFGSISATSLSSTGTITSADDIHPTSNNLVDLGKSSLQFRHIRVGSNAFIGGTVVAAAGSFTVNVTIPDDTAVLGAIDFAPGQVKSATLDEEYAVIPIDLPVDMRVTNARCEVAGVSKTIVLLDARSGSTITVPSDINAGTEVYMKFTNIVTGDDVDYLVEFRYR